MNEEDLKNLTIPNLAEVDERAGLPSASADCFWACPGQRNLMRECGNPQQAPNPDAERGTRIHKAFQTENFIDLEEEELQTYEQGVKFLDRLVTQWAQDKQLIEYKEGPREERFWMHDETLTPICSAKIDRHWIGLDGNSDYHLLIVDAKSGFVPNLLPSPRSTQLRVQLSCYLSQQEPPGFASARVAYCKAKLRFGAGDWCDFQPMDMAMAKQWVRTHLWASDQPDASRTPGRHCNHCPVKGWCLEAGAYALLPAVITDRACAVKLFTNPKGDMGGLIQASMNDLMVPFLKVTDLILLWESKGVVEKILEAVVRRLKDLTDEELQAVGLTRGKGAEVRKVFAIQECYYFLLKKGWTEEEIFDCMEFCNADLARGFRKMQGLSTDKEAVEVMRKTLADYMVTTTNEAPLKEL